MKCENDFFVIIFGLYLSGFYYSGLILSCLMNKEAYSLGEYLRLRRKEEGLPLRRVAALLDLDPSTLGKIEKNTRRASEDMIPRLAEIYSEDPRDLYIMYHSDLIIASIGGLDYSARILEATSNKLQTSKKQEP
jgi:transcriptional regulator with XRE-family HTH domain